MRKHTSGTTIQRLADATTAVGLGAVRARKIAEALWSVSEQYHAGGVTAEYWHDRNRELWHDAERQGISSDVKRILRSA